jgi:hypothetical protein
LKKNTNITTPVLNLNINKDDSELNDFLYCWEQFTTRPNKIVIHNTYSTKDFNDVLSNYIEERNSFTEFLPTEDDFVINDKMFVKIEDKKIYCSYIVIDRTHENSIINEITFFYADETNFDRIQKIIEELNECIIDFCEDETNKLNTVTIGLNGLEIEPVDPLDIDMDNFDMFYSKKTYKEIEKLVKDIKKSTSGLSILYGERGNGKTSVINYIASKLDRIVIFIPNNMIEHTISNPDFRRFLKRYSKPVIIIDDCEMLLNDAFSRSNMFVNNLMQMVDGFLSDSIEANILTIFNVEDENEIDHSLLDCNNLLRVIEFPELSSEESTDLSSHIGLNKKYKNKMRVLDIIRNNKPRESHEMGF